MTPPDESVTVPLTVPIDDCANALPAPASESTTINTSRFIIRPFLLVHRERPDSSML
jgi:hypothetical protein